MPLTAGRLCLAALLATVALALPVAAAGAAPAAKTWAGTWRATSGGATYALVLRAEGGGAYTGTYGYCRGRLSGSVRGAVLTGTWTQHPDCAGTAEPSGRFEFRLAASGRAFTGRRSYATTPGGHWHGSWNGTCSAGPCRGNGR